MAILAEMVQRVQSLYSRGVQSRDTRLTSRHIYSALLSARAILISQQVDKNQYINQWTYQILPCVELVTVPLHECPCIPPSGCMMLRSKFQIPDPISSNDKPLVQYVSSLDGGITFDLTRFDTVKYNKGDKFTSKKSGYLIKNKYLYITVLKLLDSVSMGYIAYDFLEAKAFPSKCGDCAECDCQDIMDSEFPIDGKKITALVELANKELIIIMKQMSEDKYDNSSDDTDTNSGTMVHDPNQQDQGN